MSPAGGGGRRNSTLPAAPSRAQNEAAQAPAAAEQTPSPSGHASSVENEPVQELRWTVHPAAQSPARAALVGGLILGVSLLAAQLSAAPQFGVLALLFLAFSLRAFFLPRHYAFDAAGARESGPLGATRRVAWPDVKQVRAVRFGVWLGERHNSSRMLPAHGLFVRTSGNRSEVLAAAQRAAPEASAPAAPQDSANRQDPAN
ncbi:MAG: hypothetical protein DHS20C15_06030 [Planctomycetota bacterium]|nr:MAG: hypothetical protein DHS20C15_06030 [Planctomycetota bacterium]